MAVLAQPFPPAASARGSPFVGLEPYGEDDADFFFGRERDLRIITANLRSCRLTLLYGASGVGKSSVLRAGVVHQLRERVLADIPVRRLTAGTGPARAPFAVTYFSGWRDEQPLERLMERIHASAAEALDGKAPPTWTSGEPVLDALAEWTTGVRALLVILDQFEDYFLYHGHESADGRFADEFARIVNASDLHVHFLVSLREDAWSKLDRFKATIPDLFANYLRLDYLDRDGGRRAIERSIEAYNAGLPPGSGPPYGIEPALTEAVLDGVQTGAAGLAEPGATPGRALADAGDRRVETPFLQLVMLRLWDATPQDGSHRLELSTLEALGGPQEIVRSHLERALSALDDGDKAVAAAAFRFLVTSTKSKVAQQTSDLADWTGRPEERIVEVLEALSHGRAGRILRPLPPPTGRSSPRYELFHDVLAEPILDWRKLYELDVANAERQARLDEEERRRLEAERARHAARFNRAVRWSAVLLTLLAVALAVAVVVVIRERSVARSQRLAASALAQLSIDPERSVLLAREAMGVHRTREAENALREALGASLVRARMSAGEPLEGAVTSGDGDTTATRAAREVRLWRTRDGRPVGAPIEPGGHVVDVGLSRDGAAAVVAGRDGIVLARGADRLELPQPSPVTAAAISADGRYAVTAGESQMTVWDVATAQPLARRGGLPDSADVAFDPRAPGTVALASCPGDALLWSWQAGTVRRLPRGGPAGAPCLVSFAPGGRHLATAIGEDTVRVWTADGRFITALGGRGSSQALSVLAAEHAVTWSPDGRTIAVVNANLAQWWRVAPRSDEPLGEVQQQDLMTAVGFSADGALLATATQDGTAQVWDMASGSILARLHGHVDSIKSIAFAGDGSRVVTASADGTARAWEAATGRRLPEPGIVTDVAFRPDGRRIAVAVSRGKSRISSTRGDARTRIADADFVGPPTTIQFDRSGRRVFLAGVSGAVVAHAETGFTRWRLPAPTSGPMRGAELSPNGRSVLVAAEREGVSIFDVDTRKRAAVLEGSGAAAASFSPDGRWIVAAGLDGNARIYDARTRELVQTLRGARSRLKGAAFSPDGARIVTYGFDRIPRVWERESGRRVAALRGHESWVAAAAFTPGGRRIVTAGRDATIRVWDAAIGTLLSVEHPHADIINSVAVSPDGRWILSGSDDKSARIATSAAFESADDLLRLAAHRVTRALTPSERSDFVD